MDELNQTEKIGKRGNVCSGYFYVFTKIVYQTTGAPCTNNNILLWKNIQNENRKIPIRGKYAVYT